MLAEAAAGAGVVEEAAEARLDVPPTLDLVEVGLPPPSETSNALAAGDEGREHVSLILLSAMSDSNSSYGSENSSWKKGCRERFSDGEGERKEVDVVE